MTINNLDKYVGNLWDWGFLDECFEGTKIRVSDIDGIVERNGFFLLLEAKSNGATITRGQEILFKRLVETGLFAILVIWGTPNNPERISYLTKFRTVNYSGINEDYVKDVVHNWFRWADNYPQVK